MDGADDALVLVFLSVAVVLGMGLLSAVGVAEGDLPYKECGGG